MSNPDQNRKGDQVCAVVVTYHCEPELGYNLHKLSTQVAKIVIVDNGSNDASLAIVSTAAAELDAELIRNDTNLGISAALNQGCEHAVRCGFAWIATFDQDSCVTDGMIREMLRTHAQHPARERIAVLAPRVVAANNGDGGRPPRGTPGKDVRTVKTALTSGSLIPSRVWRDVGGFDESFFIDGVDWEFCLRCREKGYSILCCTRAHLMHRIGRPTRHKLGWIWVSVSNHPPVRRYYGTRNLIFLIRRFWRTEPAWLLKRVFAGGRDVLRVIGFESRKRENLQAMGRGVLDGIRGISGPFDAGRHRAAR